jgi:hypothetical protein
VRMHKLSLGVLGLFLPLLAGCARPAVVPKPFAFQERENALRDWTLISTKIADSLSDHGLLPPHDPGKPPAPPIMIPGPFYVHVQAPLSTFLRQVADALESEVLARGGQVSRSPANSIVVNLDIQAVRFDAPAREPGGWLGPWEFQPRTDWEAMWKATIVTGTSVTLLDEAPIYVRNGDAGFYLSRHLGEIASNQPATSRPIMRMRYDP